VPAHVREDVLSRALKSDELVNEASAIVGGKTPSVLAHAAGK
jgi:hypothetical protein